jgi:hypothetical protein
VNRRRRARVGSCPDKMRVMWRVLAASIAVLFPLTAGAEPPAPGPPTCGRCGPAPMYPSWSCADGRHQGGRGPCIERQDGTCGYLRLVCPEDRPRDTRPCGPAECGEPPVVSTWSCPGTAETGGFGGCRRDREGRCGWVHHPCGVQAAGRPAPAPGSVAPPPPPPGPPPARPGPPPGRPPRTRGCGNLPGDEELRTWPVVGVCRPGGGPAPPPLRRIQTLDDGTFIFSGPSGCFRGRYIRCFSK